MLRAGQECIGGVQRGQARDAGLYCIAADEIAVAVMRYALRRRVDDQVDLSGQDHIQNIRLPCANLIGADGGNAIIIQEIGRARRGIDRPAQLIQATCNRQDFLFIAVLNRDNDTRFNNREYNEIRRKIK